MKKNLISIGIYLFIVFFAVLPAEALTISGHVEFGGPVVVTLSGDASIITVTDRSGNYSFKDLAAGGAYTITPSRDYNPPQVNITNPEGNNSVMGNVEIATDVRTDYCAYGFDPPEITIASLDDILENQDFRVMPTSCCFVVTNVKYYIDDILLYTYPASDMCQATYTYPWDTTAFSNGQHIIKITVTDDNAGAGSAEIPVTVRNDNNDMPLIGDVTNDGNIDIIDALSTAQYFVGLIPRSFNAPVADVDLDDKVDILDALLIAQYYVGLITELPEQKPGGFSQIPASSEHALAAYDFLGLELLSSMPDFISLGNIKLAFSQVVSGLNVRLVCDYYSSGTNKYQYLSAIIYFNLDMVPEDVVSIGLDIY